MRIKKKLISIYEKLYALYWERKIRLASVKPLRNVIIFESVPDVADNSKAVFDEFISRGLNKKYKLIWLLFGEGEWKWEKAFNTEYYKPWQYEARYYCAAAKAKICCNRFLPSVRQGQLSVYLSHGTAVKSVRSYYTIPEGIDYFVVASEGVKKTQAYEFNFDIERTVPLGFPRNDIFNQPDIDIHKLLNTECQKVIVWYPTFRQQKNGFKTDSPNAVPIIHNAAFAEQLNCAAKESKVLIVLKPHFVQDTSYIQDLGLSNIRIISDDFFAEHHIDSYEFVGASDALITDYSSIYFDYTLCGKPIAAVWEDISEYQKKPGFVYNYEYLMKGAEKIYSLDDLTAFVQRVGEGIDILKVERDEIRDFSNISTDGQNSSRVVDFILDKMEGN